MTKWDGVTERREPSRDGREGRRQADWHCGEHFEIQSHTKEHRETVCQKIKEVKSNLTIEVEKLEQSISELNKSMISKYWFRIVIGAMFASLIYIAGQNRLSNTDQIDALKTIARDQKEVVSVVNNIENKQIEMSGQIKIFELEIKALNNRQDVLRDAHLKIVQQQADGRDGRDGKTGRDGRDSPRP
jgi:predicted  nucleic acid-binding Zn-ribbon protein